MEGKECEEKVESKRGEFGNHNTTKRDKGVDFPTRGKGKLGMGNRQLSQTRKPWEKRKGQ